MLVKLPMARTSAQDVTLELLQRSPGKDLAVATDNLGTRFLRRVTKLSSTNLGPAHRETASIVAVVRQLPRLEGVFVGPPAAEGLLITLSWMKYDSEYAKEKSGRFPIRFGVADSIKQVMEYGKPFIEDEDSPFILLITPIHKADELKASEYVRLKWCVAGPYIGNREIKGKRLSDSEARRFVLFRFVPLSVSLSSQSGVD